MQKIKIIFAAQDPGGFNTLWPVIKKTGGKVFLDGKSKEIANGMKMKFTDCQGFSEYDVAEIIKKNKPEIIVTGSSQGVDSLDKKFIRMGKRIGVKTVAILDFWLNYKERFEFAMPDKIFVMDRIAKLEMIAEKFPKDKIVVTGNPLFDTFKKSKKKGEIIVFFSQPFSEYGYELGLDEVRIFGDIVDALNALKIKIPIKIRLHPRENNKSKFDDIIRKSGLEIKVTDETVEELIDQAKLVLGMNSMTLLQSCFAEKKVLSYQIGLNQKDPLITNRVGLSEAIYFKKKLRPALKKILEDKVRKSGGFKLIRNATNNVIKTIDRAVALQTPIREAGISVVLFAEGGGKTGLGHLRRSMVLAKELIDQGDNVRFLVRNEIAKNWLKKQCHELKIYRLEKTESDIAIIDSYVVTAKEMKLFNAKLTVGFDDFSYSKGRYDIKISPLKHFQVVSPEFKKYIRRNNHEKLKNILITLGGFSSKKNLDQIIKILDRNLYSITVILPPSFSYNETGVKTVKDPKSMGALFEKCDLTISSGGQTIFELAATGTPTIVIRHVDNQKNNIKLIKQLSILKFAGWSKDKNLHDNLQHAINELKSKSARNKQTKLSKQKVDFKGVKRIISLIKKNANTLHNTSQDGIISIAEKSADGYSRKAVNSSRNR